MQLFPTRATFHVGLLAAVFVAAGTVAKVPLAVASGSAMVLAIALGRAVDYVCVSRLRSHGFEMVWLEPRRATRCSRGSTTVIHCELRNRSDLLVRGTGLRALSSSMLDVHVEPESVDMPPQSKTRVTLQVNAPRVGRWGIHGVALEVRSALAGGEGLYEVPLLFANPHGIEVHPAARYPDRVNVLGGKSRRHGDIGRPSRDRGDGEELREIRPHAPGDPFRRIAWKASAKRGVLLVREMEREDRDIVWLVVEASVELWAGSPGDSALDRAVDEVYGTALLNLRKGNPTGLIVTGARPRSEVAPAAGKAHALKIAQALSSASNFSDVDRTELEESDLCDLVYEHMRPLDPTGLSRVSKSDAESVALRADAIRSKAPFFPRPPFAKTATEQKLRHYLAAFGVELPPKLAGECARSQVAVVDALARLLTGNERPSTVYVWATVPPETSGLAKVARQLRRARVAIRWTIPDVSLGWGEYAETLAHAGDDDAHVSFGPRATGLTMGEAIRDAAYTRFVVKRRAERRFLRSLGIIVPLGRPASTSRARDAGPGPESGRGHSGTDTDSSRGDTAADDSDGSPSRRVS
jgi:uncharacterized protein (DUF58 family)